MEKEKISIIIPVYKVEQYLECCLDSIIKQTYSNLEIILVDDASPDGCGEICDRYAERDARFRVLHKRQNNGASQARNDGMDMAEGDYFFFVDSDDWLAPDACETLYNSMQEYGADCCVGHSVVVWDHDGVLKQTEEKCAPTHCASAQEVMKRTLLTMSAAWNRLYPRRLIADLRFPAGRINDDECFALRAYSRMEKILFLDRDTYYYRKRPNSITTSRFSLKALDCVKNSLENMEFVRENAPELMPCAEYKYIKTMLWGYVNLRKVRPEEREKAKKMKKELRAQIREYRGAALHNRYLSVPLKALAVLCSL